LANVLLLLPVEFGRIPHREKRFRLSSISLNNLLLSKFHFTISRQWHRSFTWRFPRKDWRPLLV
jgi:hypothetical protein